MARTPVDQIAPLQIPIRVAAQLLSYNTRTIVRLVERGELEAIGQGKLRRITTASLHDFQRRHRVGVPQ